MTERGVVDNVGKEPVHSHAMLQIMAVDQIKRVNLKSTNDRNGNWRQKTDGAMVPAVSKQAVLVPSGAIVDVW